MEPTKSAGGTKKSQGRTSKAPAPQETSPETRRKPRTTRKTGTKKPNKKKIFEISNEVKKTALAIAILVAVCLTTAMLVDIFVKARRPVAPEIHTDKERTPVAPPQIPAQTPKAPVQTQKPKVPAQTPPEKNFLPPKKNDQPAIEPKFITKAEGLKEKELTQDNSTATRTPAHKKGSAIVYEVYDDVTPTPPKKVVVPKRDDSVPQIAIIIDDIGYDKDIPMALLNIDKNITFSVLPFSPAGTQLAHKLSANGAELMLHLPMEPTEYPRVNPGPGALLSAMSPDELLTQLHKDIHAVPGAVGVNNHMGSRLTTDSDKMNQIFRVLKQNNLFFIDSRTSVETKGEKSARRLKLKFSHRNVFLDNVQNVESISKQIGKLIKEARENGHAIGIGHPHQATLDALKRELPKTRGKVRLVPVSRLVEVLSG